MSWPTVALGEFMPSKIPSVNPAKFPAETFELWSIPAFDAGEPEILLGSDIGSSKKCIAPGDVLLSRIVPHIRRSCVVAPRTSYRQIASGEWITFRGNAFDPNYMRQILVSDPFNAEFMQTVAGVGGSLLRARPEGVKLIKIPLPPLEEQKRIAGILDQADALRRLRTRALDKLNTLGQAIFYEMFGDVASNSKGLNKARIGDHCERVSVGVVIKPASYYQEKGVPAVRGTNIKPTGIDLSEVVYFSEEDNSGALKKSRIYGGDVLIVRTGRPGLAAVVPKELDGTNCIDVLITTTKIKTLLPEFLRDFLNSADGRSLVLSGSVGQVQQHFNVKSLANAEIPLPSLAEQGRYLERTLQLEKQRRAVEKHLNKLNCNFASLQHRAFRGEL